MKFTAESEHHEHTKTPNEISANQMIFTTRKQARCGAHTQSPDSKK